MGRPPLTTKKATQSRNSKTKINPDAKIRDIYTDPEGTQYRCAMCGKFHNKQKGFFYVSASVMYKGNNGYIDICKTCCDKLYTHFVEFFSGNEEKALDRMCSIFDWYYNDDIVGMSTKTSADVSRIALYVRNLNLTQNKKRGTSYSDTIKDRSTETIDSFEQFEDIKENSDDAPSKRAIKNWGLGYTPEEYVYLDEHYKMLKGQIADDDVVQEALIKDLCSIKVLQSRSMKEGNADSYEKFTKLYQSTLKSANIKPKGTEVEVTNDENTCWGVFIRDIEEHSPAEVYLDRGIFDDADGIKDYFERFIVRPFKNFFSGSNDMDKEFSIAPGGDDSV